MKIYIYIFFSPVVDAPSSGLTEYNGSLSQVESLSEYQGKKMCSEKEKEEAGEQKERMKEKENKIIKKVVFN